MFKKILIANRGSSLRAKRSNPVGATFWIAASLRSSQ
jgi:hypothetical protein